MGRFQGTVAEGRMPVNTGEGERDNSLRLLAINGANLPVRSYPFDDNNMPLHLFYCYWDGQRRNQIWFRRETVR